jgi:hypothetical protein
MNVSCNLELTASNCFECLTQHRASHGHCEQADVTFAIHQWPSMSLASADSIRMMIHYPQDPSVHPQTPPPYSPQRDGPDDDDNSPGLMTPEG